MGSVKSIGARVSAELYNSLSAIAREKGITISDLVKEAIEIYLQLSQIAESRSTTPEQLVSSLLVEFPTNSDEPANDARAAPASVSRSDEVAYLRGRLEALESILSSILQGISSARFAPPMIPVNTSDQLLPKSPISPQLLHSSGISGSKVNRSNPGRGEELAKREIVSYTHPRDITDEEKEEILEELLDNPWVDILSARGNPSPA